MKDTLNWEPDKDKLLKPKEVEIHKILHKKKKEESNYTVNNKRIEYIETAEKIIGEKINGTMLDIGSGNGYSSVYFAKNRDVKVFSMECNTEGTQLIMNNFNKNGVDESKYETVLGSFNNIPLKNHFDFVISLGTLHHSPNLLRTMKELYSTLKPGGYILAHEPYMDDTVQNSEFNKKNESIKHFQQIIHVKEGDRDDHFFRRCEWLTACYQSGFEVNFKEVPIDNPTIRNFILMIRKPLEDQPIPHNWDIKLDM